MPTTLEQIQYGFDRNSRRTWQKRPLTDMQDQQYNYDALSQVNAATRGSLNLNATAISGVPAAAESWEYDPTGNWRGYHTAANGTSMLDQHRVHDRGNRVTQIEDNPNNMILDRVGRMRQMSPDAAGDWDGKLEITWDAWSRTTSVKNNGTLVGDYSYDGTHRRITREVEGETLHSYYNDAWRPVEERKDAETTAAISYLWGARHRDDLVRRDRAVGGTSLNETRYVLMDYFNPAALTDKTGAVTERYAFSAFGVRTILNSDFTLRSSSECAMEFGFQGQFLDVESGLMNYGYRYYSPYLGRWTCKDPIGEDGGINLYSLGNNPVNQVDYLGAILYETDIDKCELKVFLKWDVEFPAQSGYPSINTRSQIEWKAGAEKLVESYFNNLNLRCMPATPSCPCCQDGLKVNFDLQFGKPADFSVKVYITLPDEDKGRSWVNRRNNTAHMKYSDSQPRQRNNTQDVVVHETGHMLGGNHPGKKGAADEYTKDSESLMGAGMTLRLKDFQHSFCDRATTGKPGCDPWKGE